MKLKLKLLPFFFLLLAFLCAPNITSAHSPDHSYLYLRFYKESMAGRFELTAKDINKALGTQLSDDLTMEAITPLLPQIYDYLISHSAFQSAEGKYSVRFTEPTILDLTEMEDFARFHFEFDGVKTVPESLDITYTVLFDKDPKHRGILVIEHNWKAGIFDNEAMLSTIFSAENTQDNLSLKDTSIWKGFRALVKLGIWHIWIGLDHILFLVALILPAVVRRKETEGQINTISHPGQWIPVDRFKPAFWYILKIITFFTIAHSLTLALASLHIIDLPSRFVESIIALSIALAAFHNIRPIFFHKEWLIAFGFGLFHGFGFASVLGEKGLGGEYMTWSLLGFNVGVEIGQVLIICMIFPFLFLLRKQKIYPAIITYGSIVLILISLYWFVERGFEVDLPLGAYFWKAYSAVFG